MNKMERPNLVISTAEVDAASARPAPASPATVLAIVCVGICLANLDLFIVNVALPNIGRDFRDAPLEDMSWVLNGYAIAYAALLVFFGRVAERYRRNISFLLGVGLFTLSSAACAAADSVVTLTAFRLVQAAGAALMTPTSLGLLLAAFPPERRDGAVRTWTAIGGLAAALGPVIGGVLVTVNRRWIFLVNVPIGLVAMLVGWWKLPEVPGHEAPRPHPFDALLVTGGIGALTFAIVKVNDWGWHSTGIGISFIAAIVLLAWFVWRCLRSDSPFVDPALFRIRQFTGAALVMAPYSAAFGAMLLSRFGAAAVVTAGIFFFVVGLSYWASVIGLQPNAALVIMGMIPTGIGVGLTFPTLMGVAASGLRSSSFATGSGVINMIRQAALAIGVAIFVAIVGSPVTPVERVAAFHRGWWIMAPIAALGLIPTFFLVRPGRK